MFNFGFDNLPMAPEEGGGSAPQSGSPSSDGGSASPPTPSTPTPPPSSATPAPQSHSPSGGLKDAESDTDFVIPDFGGEDLDVVEIPADSASSEDATTTAPVPLEVAPAVVPPAPDGQKPATVPQESTAAQPQPPVPAAPDVPNDPGQLAQMLNQNRDSVIDALAKGPFALTPQEVEMLQEDAVKAVPRLLARTHLDAVSTALNHISNLVPRMIELHMRVKNANTDAKNEFFKANPVLDPRLHGKDVERLARLYRAANPNAALADVIRDVGALAVQTLKLTPQAPTPTPKPNGASPQPFVPAMGGSPKGPPQQAEVSPWEGLGIEFD